MSRSPSPPRKGRRRPARPIHKIVPHVVEVDSLGAALAIKLAENGAHPTDERIVRYHLAAFIRGARQVMTDRIAMKKGLEQVYAYTRGSARTYLDEHYGGNNPFEIAKTYLVVPSVTSLLRLSPTLWQVRWTKNSAGSTASCSGRASGKASSHRVRAAHVRGHDSREPARAVCDGHPLDQAAEL
ncbi:MAG: VirB8/TrbF family protein [Gammaproteobacteria bacterium]